MRLPLLLVVLAVAAMTADLVRADVAAAMKYLTEAGELVDKGSMFFDDAAAKLDLAEAELDDVPAADKAPLEKRIGEMRARLTSAADDQARQTLTRKLDRLVDDAEQAAGNMVTWPGAAASFRDLIDDAETTRVLGTDAVAAYKKKFSTFERVHGRKALQENLAGATAAVERLEAEWKEHQATLSDADASPNSKSRAAELTQRTLESAEETLKDFPDDDAGVNALRERVARVGGAFGDLAGASQVNDFLEELTRRVELYQDEFDGMDQETSTPTWEQFSRESSQKMSRLGLPATIAYVSRMEDLLQRLEDNENYNATKGNAKVKAAVEAIRGKVATAKGKVAANAAALVAGLEQAGVNKDNETSADSLRDSVRFAMGEEADEAKALLARIDARLKAYEDATAGAETARAELYKKLAAEAEAAWPAILAGYQTEEGFDPNNPDAFKGKLIKIETDNLVGWRFKTGDFPFATTLGGLPVAGRYDPAVQKAVDEVQTAIGRGLGDSDEDGRWTVVARVEGTTGRLVQLVRHEGDVKVDGATVGTVTGTEERPVDAPIVTILAARCGPLAVGANAPRSEAPPAPTPANADATPPAEQRRQERQMAVVAQPGQSARLDGDPPSDDAALPPVVAAMPAAASPSGGVGVGTRIFAILTGLFGIAVGGGALMKARFAPLATNAGAAQLSDRIGGQNLAYLGLVAIAWGAVGLVFSLLGLLSAPLAALISLVGAASLIVAGFVIGGELFEQRGIVSPDTAAKVRGLAVPAGLICVAFGILGVVAAML